MDLYEKQAEKILEKVNSVLLRRGIVDAPLPLEGWAGPDFMGNAYAFVLDVDRFPGRKLELLHDPNTLHDISTNLGGVEVTYINTHGFAYVISERKRKEVDLVEAMCKVRCVAVIGTPESGKTTLVQHCIERKFERYERVIVLDPKPGIPGKWGRAEVIGQGGKWGDMVTALGFMAEQTRKGLLTRTLVVIDEFLELGRLYPEAVSDAFTLLIVGQELRVDLIIMTQTQYASGNNLKNMSDLFSRFVKITIKHNQLSDSRRAYIDVGEGAIPGRLPGRFMPVRMLAAPVVSEFTQPAQSASEPGLPDFETKLVQLAVYKNKGEFGLGQIIELIKAHQKQMGIVWGQDGYTDWKIRKLAERWEKEGLLTPMVQGVPPVPRNALS